MIWESATGPVDVTTVTRQALSGNAQLQSAGGWLMGLTVSNADPTNPLVITLFDGADANGEYLLTVRLPVNATSRQSPGLPGQPLELGLFAIVTSGSADITCTIGRTKAGRQ